MSRERVGSAHLREDGRAPRAHGARSVRAHRARGPGSSATPTPVGRTRCIRLSPPSSTSYRPRTSPPASASASRMGTSSPALYSGLAATDPLETAPMTTVSLTRAGALRRRDAPTVTSWHGCAAEGRSRSECCAAARRCLSGGARRWSPRVSPRPRGAPRSLRGRCRDVRPWLRAGCGEPGRVPDQRAVVQAPGPDLRPVVALCLSTRHRVLGPGLA